MKVPAATIFVAASDASADVRAVTRAAYLCDGTADNVQIQAAIDALPSGGGKVVLSEGTFEIGDSLTMAPSQKLSGVGKATILMAKASLNKDIIVTAAGANRYIELTDFKIDGNRANNTSGRGIYLQSPRNCMLNRLWIVGTDEEAVRLSGVAGTLGWYNWITHCEIDNCDDGIRIFGFCEQNWILHNTITFVIGKGVFADGNLDIIAHNAFDECTGSAIHLEFGAGAWRVFGNRFDNCGTHDIALRSADKTSIFDNFFGGAAAGAAHIMNGPNGNDGSDYVIVSRNHMVETGGAGSYGIQELTATTGCHYEDNLITGPTTRIALHASSTGTVLSSSAAPVTIPILTDSGNIIWTDQPAALTEFAGLARNRTKADLSNATQARLVVRVLGGGAAGATLHAQYSTDESTWAYLDGAAGPSVSISSANTTQASAWVTLAAAARADVALRVAGLGGDAVADPGFGLITIQVR